MCSRAPGFSKNRSGPSKHRERLLASSPSSNAEQGIGVTESLLNSGVLTFLYRPLSMHMGNALQIASDCEKIVCTQLKITDIKKGKCEQVVLRDSSSFWIV